MARIGTPVYQSPRWWRLRASLIRPLSRCRLCRAYGPRLHLDHIRPLRTHWHLRFTPSNLQILCGSCHRRKYREDRLGYSAAIGTDGWPIDKEHPFYEDHTTNS